MDLFFGLLGGFFVGGGVGYVWARLRQRARRRAARWRDPADPRNQLRLVEEAALRPKKPINREAYRAFRAVELHLARRALGHRLLAEVSMGAFVAADGEARASRRVYSAYGSKRVDFLVIDRLGRPVAAIEYQGTGHYSHGAAMRDAVKRRALQKAGIPLIDIDGAEDIDGGLYRLDGLLPAEEEAAAADGWA